MLLIIWWSIIKFASINVSACGYTENECTSCGKLTKGFFYTSSNQQCKSKYNFRASSKKTMNIDSFLDIDIQSVDDVEEKFVASLTDKLSKYCDNCKYDTIHMIVKDIL